ncbi:MAG: PEGA domain-containing protein [Bacteroidota bacterium]
MNLVFFNRSSLILFFTLTGIIAFSSGCATLFTGTTDNVYIQSQPEGAKIFVEGLDVGTTPATVPIKRPGLSDKQVTLRLDGYEDRVFLLQAEFNVVSILNLFGLVGWVVDIATGAIRKYSPKNYDIELESRRQSLNIDMSLLERDSKGRYIIPRTNAEKLVLRDERNNNFMVLTR